MTRVHKAGAVWVLWLAFGPVGWGLDWPTYRHDNARSGVTAERLAPTLSRQWTFAPAHGPRPSWPDPVRERARVRFDAAFHVAAGGGLVYFGSSANGVVYGLDGATGSIRWRFITGGAVRFAPCLWEGRLYAASDDGFIYCLSPRDGAVLWKVRAALEEGQIIGHGKLISVQPPRAGVLVDGGTAYFACGLFPNEGVALCAVDAATGKRIWRNDTFGNVYQRMPHGGTHGFTGLSPQGYMLASPERIYVPNGRSVPAAFARDDGRLLFWRGNVHHEGGAWALLADGVLYSGAPRLLPPEATAKYYDTPDAKPGDGTRLSYDAARLMGRDAATGSDRFVMFPGERVVVTAETSYVQRGGQVSAIDRERYAALGAKENGLSRKLMSHFWRYYKPSLNVRVVRRKQRGKAPLSEADSKMMAEALEKLKEGDAKRAVIEAQMREVKAQIAAIVKWTCDTECDGEMILAGDMLYVAGEGKVRGLDAATGRVLWTGEVTGCARGLAVSDGRLLVSCDNGRIDCFGQRSVPSPSTVAEPAQEHPYGQDRRMAVCRGLAEEITKRAGIGAGFCVVWPAGEGRLVCALAQRTDLTVYGYEHDADNVAVARSRLHAAGLLGTRANVFHSQPGRLPCGPYLADVVVCLDKAAPAASEAVRVLRPYGGVALLQTPGAATLSELRAQAGLTVSADREWAKVVRGPLPGAGEWRHEYADAGNTGSSLDELVRSPFRLLWFGRPGMARVVDRHRGAAAPLFAKGLLFHQGINYLWGINAYNGRVCWERPIKGAMRYGVRSSCGNMCATHDGLFVAVGKECLRLDPATGRTVATYPMPGQGTWSWLATDDVRLFGSSGRSQYDCRDVFALDIGSREALWRFRAGAILSPALALGGGKVFFLDSKPKPEEVERVRQARPADVDEPAIPRLPLPGQPYYPAGAKRQDIRTLVALDAKAGRELWRVPMDLTEFTREPAIICTRGMVLVFANMDGHRFAARSAADGALLWQVQVPYFRRPAVIGDTIYTLPCAFDLRTGKLKMRTNPITGEPTPFAWSKAYGCGGVSASKHTMFFRSGSLGYYDVTQDVGVGNFGGLKPSCWISQIAAGGLWLAPEGSAGCTCAYPIRSTVALRPASRSETAWACYPTGIAVTPVKHLAINFAGRGDRRDGAGRVWFAWPRPASRFGLKLPIKAEQVDGLGDLRRNPQTAGVTGSDRPWVYASGVRGLRRCTIPLLDKGQGPGRYTVRLHFVEPTHTRPGQRVFDVKLQGATVLQGFDLFAAAGARDRAVCKEVGPVAVAEKLDLELVPSVESPSAATAPLICGVEVVRAEPAPGE